MTTAETLTAARKFVETPERWARGYGRRFERRCAGYAIIAATEGRHPFEFTAAVNAFRRVIGTDEIHQWNDAPQRTHGDVLAAFDRAIEAESKATGATS